MKNIQNIKTILNRLIGLLNYRIVNGEWGPRGFVETFKRIRKAGILPSQIVDVGASKGVWTLECMSVFPDAFYFVVDPLEENWAFLEKLTMTYPSVRAWKGALGPDHGYLTMHIHGDQSSFLESEYSDPLGSSRKEVEMRPLDSFLCSPLKPPDLIKIDVQGFELEVLKGAEKCLSSCEILLLEVSFYKIYRNSPLAHDVIAFLRERGFRIFDICTYAQRPYNGALCQSDMVFAKNNSRLFEHEGYE